MRPPQPIRVRFERFVNRTANCWLWIGGTTKDGYGKFGVPASFSVDGRRHTVRAHRVAWCLAHGRWPTHDEQVLHTCDNRLCVRPDHLFLGTHTDNMRDMVSKGRDAASVGTWRGGPQRPEKARLAKLTMAEARRIRIIAAAGVLSQVEIGRMFGVSDCTVRDIVKGRTWIEARWNKP